MKQLIETIEPFHNRGIGLKSLQDPIAPAHRVGEPVFHIFAALAEFERGVIRKRATAGLQARASEAVLAEGPPALSAKDLQAAKALL